MKKTLAILALLEGLVLGLSLYAGVFLRFGGDFSAAQSTLVGIFPRGLVFVWVVLVAVLSVGLYRLHQDVRFVDTLARLVGAVVLAAVAHSVLYYMIPAVSVGRGVYLLSLGFSLAGLLVSRTLFYSWVGNESLKANVLVFGRGKTAASLAELCSNLRHRSFRLVGFLPAPDESAHDICVPVLADSRPLLEIVCEYQVDEIIVAMDNRRSGFPLRSLLDCRLAGIKITEALTFAERETGMIDLKSLHPSWLIYGTGFRRST